MFKYKVCNLGLIFTVKKYKNSSLLNHYKDY